MDSLKTILNQTIYDATIQAYGGLDDLGKILSDLSLDTDLNDNLPIGVTIELEDTDDALGRKFRLNNTQFANGEDPGCGVSEDVILANYPNITIQEENELINFIRNEKACGNFCVTDDFYPFFLEDAATTKSFYGRTYIPYSPTAKISGGYQTDGVSAKINTGFVPSTMGVNYKANDAFMGLYALRNAGFGLANKEMAGAGGSYPTYLRNNVSLLDAGINNISVASPPAVSGAGLYSVSVGGGKAELKKDGNIIAQSDRVGTTLTSLAISVGARFLGVSTWDYYCEGDWACIVFAGKAGFDAKKHYENVTKFLSRMGYV